MKSDEINSTTGKNNEKIKTVFSKAFFSSILIVSNFLNSASSLLKTWINDIPAKRS